MKTRTQIYNNIAKSLSESSGSTTLDKKAEGFKYILQEFVDNLSLITIEPERIAYFEPEVALEKFSKFYRGRTPMNYEDAVEHCKLCLLERASIPSIYLDCFLASKGIANFKLAKQFLEEIGFTCWNKKGNPLQVDIGEKHFFVFRYIGV